jgi:parallel beta helix pectate lyase-like protein/pectate lyase-like protein
MSNVRNFGAKGDGKTDDTAALSHAVQQGDGHLLFPRGEYVISEPLYVPLEQVGRFAIDGLQAKLIMTGPGPALHLVGTHKKTAQPEDFVPGVWQKERMPWLRGLEIVGSHPAADGIRLEGVMQPTLQGLLIRRCRHGVHLTKRDRNVVIADCHIYDNSGVGVFFDKVNLHQTNIHGNHISYCKQGGIKIIGSEIRNLQICSNDIEYNYDAKVEGCADVCFDCREGTVREGTIVGNTIQAKQSPGGANIRLIGVGKSDPNAVGLLAITGNLLGSQETVLHLRSCRGVVVSGNAIYSGYHRAIWAEDAEHLVIGSNSIDHNPEYRGKSTDTILLEHCRNVALTGLVHQHTLEAMVEADASVLVRECENVNLTGCQIIHARKHGVDVHHCRQVRIADCTIQGRAADDGYLSAVQVDAGSSRVMVVNNFLAKGAAGSLQMPEAAGTAMGNM